ncbi:MAG: CAP domain-containing protein [Syntrophobacterales bacterium]|jgi:uncharacterized protein YkwD|nr:CAP domain-containing protein [Syntrophobacterales bacterium]
MRRITTQLTIWAVFLLLTVSLASCALPAKKIADGILIYNEGIGNFTLTAMEDAAMRKLNDLRERPGEWADYLAGLKHGPIMSRSNTEDTNDAILFLKKMNPRRPFTVSKGLCLAAAALVKDHGPKGLSGHRGSDGNNAFYRMNGYGLWDGKAGENLYYGHKDADRLIVALLTEGGSQGLEQRNNIFSEDFHFIGIACGAHKVYNTMCVINFAEKYTEMP